MASFRTRSVPEFVSSEDDEAGMKYEDTLNNQINRCSVSSCFLIMNDLPKAAHPTAKAFFEALDRHNLQQEGEDSDGGSVTKKKKVSTMSESLKRKSQSLGWRNRHSQNEYYPVNVLQPAKEDKSSSDYRSEQRRLQSRNFSVRQVQRGEVEGTYGTGATVWPAAVVLMKYIEHLSNSKFGNSDKYHSCKATDKNRDDTLVTFRGKHILDLGAGTGVTSIAAALLGAASVVCTDGEESVVRLANDNIQWASRQLLAPQGSEEIGTTINVEDRKSNDDTTTIDGCPIRSQTYWWGKDTSLDLVGCVEESYKSCGLVILVADCVLPKLYPIAPLVQAIDECFQLHDEHNQQDCSTSTQSSACAILSYEHRYYPDYDPRDEFRRLASERSLEVFNVPREEMDPVYSLEDVELWVIRRRN